MSRAYSDDEATIIMVDSNIQREDIGEDAEPSEVYMKWMEVAEEILSKNRK